jgi:hypothetical protein
MPDQCPHSMGLSAHKVKIENMEKEIENLKTSQNISEHQDTRAW